MSIDISNQKNILATASAHAAFTGAITDMLRWFEKAVAGYRAEADFDENLEQVKATRLAQAELPVQLTNTFDSYERSLRAAYADFGREVVTRLGFDEPAQVRNLALNIAGGAFQQARSRARDLLVSQIEGYTVAG